jgi:hypothetical protein
MRLYLAGAALSFGFVLFTREAFTIYFTLTGASIGSFNKDLLGLSVILHFIGGLLGGYLVSRRRNKEILRAGVTTALFAYILEFLVDGLFIGQFANGIWIAASYIAGSGLGVLYSNYKRWGRLLEPRREGRRVEKLHDMEMIQDLIIRSQAVLRERGYDANPLESQEFVDYITGPTPMRDETTLADVLEKRYLTIHEVAEMSELKKKGIILTNITAMDHLNEVYESHLMAFDLELSLALDEGSLRWVQERVGLIDSWLRDESIPEELAQSFMDLKNKFSDKLSGVREV